MESIQHAPEDRVGTAAAQVIFADSAAAIMAIAIMISTFGCTNGLILAGARVYYAMAQSGLFYKEAGELNEHGVPVYFLWQRRSTSPSFHGRIVQKLFRKVSPGIISIMVIVNLAGMLMPVTSTMLLQHEPNASSHVTMQIVAPKSVEHLAYLAPKLSYDLIFSYFSRQLAGLFSFINCLALFDGIQACIEKHHYFRNNDLHFNIPFLTYRQPLSEHSSEG